MLLCSNQKQRPGGAYSMSSALSQNHQERGAKSDQIIHSVRSNADFDAQSSAINCTTCCTIISLDHFLLAAFTIVPSTSRQRNAIIHLNLFSVFAVNLIIIFHRSIIPTDPPRTSLQDSRTSHPIYQKLREPAYITESQIRDQFLTTTQNHVD